VSAALEQEASVFLKPYHHRCVFVSSISISFAKGQIMDSEKGQAEGILGCLDRLALSGHAQKLS
jgi:hypothetical protein